jgi:hypothetical protein
VTFSLLALEEYNDGCAVTYRMHRRSDEQRPHLSPEIKIRARDDRGERYKGWSLGCGGGGDGELFTWRGAHSLIPALDPRAAADARVDHRLAGPPRIVR